MTPQDTGPAQGRMTARAVDEMVARACAQGIDGKDQSPLIYDWLRARDVEDSLTVENAALRTRLQAAEQALAEAHYVYPDSEIIRQALTAIRKEPAHD